MNKHDLTEGWGSCQQVRMVPMFTPMILFKWLVCSLIIAFCFLYLWAVISLNEIPLCVTRNNTMSSSCLWNVIRWSHLVKNLWFTHCFISHCMMFVLILYFQLFSHSTFARRVPKRKCSWGVCVINQSAKISMSVNIHLASVQYQINYKHCKYGMI